MLLYKYFLIFFVRFVLQLFVKEFSKFYELLFPRFANFCFPENLLVAAANRFKILEIFLSLIVTVYIYRTADYGPRKPEMPRILNGNLIVLKWQNIHVISNIKQREKEQNLAKQFTLHSAEAYSEPFPTSKQGGYVIGGNYFYKKLHLRCLKRF